MKIEASRRQHHPARNLIKDWLFTVNLFFILYSLVMLAQFIMGPESGRVSTLVCKPDPWGKKVCTVKIYGFHKLFRLDFYADDYMGTVRSSNDYSTQPPHYLSDLSLPWNQVEQQGSSGDYVCAVSIRTQRQVVDFVPPYQKGSVCSQAEAQLKEAFWGDRSAIDIRFNGINPNLYWRVTLLGIAGLLFLAQCTVRLRRTVSVRKKPWLWLMIKRRISACDRWRPGGCCRSLRRAGQKAVCPVLVGGGCPGDCIRSTF